MSLCLVLITSCGVRFTAAGAGRGFCAAMAFPVETLAPEVSFVAAVAWPGLAMWMLKARCAGAGSGGLTSSWALDLVPRGLALSARTSRGVLTAAQSRTRCRRSSLSIALLRLFLQAAASNFAIADRQGPIRVPMIARVTCDVGAMRFGLT